MSDKAVVVYTIHSGNEYIILKQQVAPPTSPYAVTAYCSEKDHCK